MSLTRAQLQRAATTYPWTKDFRHTLPFPRHWLKRTSLRDPFIKSVPVKDRIKWWNIVPGDQIRLLGDNTNTIHEVLSINKISNRVFLKGTQGSEEQTKQGKLPPSKNVHYSRCQLFIGTFEFPAKHNPEESSWKPVFTKRTGMTKPHFATSIRRWDWKRFALKTVPSLPNWFNKRIHIPWPTPEPRSIPPASSYDTPADAVTEITYKLPSLPSSVSAAVPQPAKESEYVNTLFSPQPVAPDPSQPFEAHLYKELSNPHSRAKKQARWQAYQRYKTNLLDEMVAKELKDLKGRSIGEAKAEAMFKWKLKLEDDRKADKKRRWNSKETLDRMAWKKAKKETREAKKKIRLGKLVLTEEPNQVVPS